MIRIYFGNPGCGKTTLACRLLYKIKKNNARLAKKDKFYKSKYYHCYTNFETKLAKEFPLDKLGPMTPPVKSYLIIDEAGIEYNSRKYKSLSQETISWFKLHRHYQCDVDVISQSWEDMDITLRRLADQLWCLKKLGPFTMARRIYKRVGIDENTHQIIDEYRMGSLIMHLLPFPFHQHNIELFLRKPYYKWFDTYSRPNTSIYCPELEEKRA